MELFYKFKSYILLEVIIIYKELVKKNIHYLTPTHIKNYALSKNECLTNEETLIIYKYIISNYNELLNKNTSSLNNLKQHLRKDLFQKIVQLYNEYAHKYL